MLQFDNLPCNYVYKCCVASVNLLTLSQLKCTLLSSITFLCVIEEAVNIFFFKTCKRKNDLYIFLFKNNEKKW